MLIISCHWKLITFRTEVKVKCKKRGNFFIMFQHKCIVANLKSSFVVLNCTSVIFPIGKNSKSGERPGFSVLLILDGFFFFLFFEHAHQLRKLFAFNNSCCAFYRSRSFRVFSGWAPGGVSMLSTPPWCESVSLSDGVYLLCNKLQETWWGIELSVVSTQRQ